MMTEFRAKVAVLFGVSVLAALSACGAHSEQTTDELAEYCASIAGDDVMCSDIEPSAEPSTAKRSTKQTGDAYPGTEEMGITPPGSVFKPH